MEKDSKIKSLTESLLNILIGFCVAYLSNILVLPLFGYDVTYSNSFYIACIFTIISLIRSYIIRRLFVSWIYETIINLIIKK